VVKVIRQEAASPRARIVHSRLQPEHVSCKRFQTLNDSRIPVAWACY